MKHNLIIKNYDDASRSALAFLEYDDSDDIWSCTISENAERKYLPAILFLFVEKGIFKLDNEWTRKFIKERVVPAERHNIGTILHDIGLQYYDEFKILMFVNGRCCQDNCYLVEI